MAERKTLTEVDELARALRAENPNHPLADTLEGCARGWRHDIAQLVATLERTPHALPLGDEQEAVIVAISEFEDKTRG